MSRKQTLAESMRHIMETMQGMEEDVPGINLRPDEPAADTQYGVDLTVDIENMHELAPRGTAMLGKFETWLDKVMLDAGMTPTHPALRTVGFLFYASRKRVSDYRKAAQHILELEDSMGDLLRQYTERTAPDLELKITPSLNAANRREKWWAQVHPPELGKLARGGMTMGQMLLHLEDQGLVHRGSN